MANPTSNFNWQMPTSSDLVTDLPADFETFGQAVDTSLADLKGGTTGQILSKASNTDMDFTWTAANPGDITAVTAGTGITGGGTSGAVTVSFDQANFGGGQGAAAKNAVINGGMDIWQRGTSFTISSASYYAYTADRWNPVAGSTGRTASRQNSGLTGIQYCQRIARDSGNTNTSAIQLAYQLESADSYRFAGQAVTLSFYARAGANYSPTSSVLATTLVSGTSTDGNVNAGGLTTTVVTGNQTLTTSWQRFQITGTVSSAATQVGFYFVATPTGTAGANDWFEVTGVQLELGSIATPFARTAGTIQAELSACQRYYERVTPNSQNITFPGFNNSSTVGYASWAFKATKRVNPTITLGAAASDWGIRIPGGSNAQLSAYSVIGNTLENAWLSGTTTGLTSGNGNFLVNVGNNGYLEASAEL